MTRTTGRPKPTLSRVTAAVLVPCLSLVGVPIAAAAPAPVELAAPPPPVKPNTTVPVVPAPVLRPSFSLVPTDGEIARARVFEEPLAADGSTGILENRALAAALLRYADARKPEDLSAVETFVRSHPRSAWNVSLLANLGLVAHQTGYVSRALAYHERAWREGRSSASPRTRALAERAASEYAWLLASLGHQETLETLLDEIEDRTFSGSSAERIRLARQALWMMQNRPEEAFRCGPIALDRVLQALGRPADESVAHSPATRRGTSLARLGALAQTAGATMHMAKRIDAAAALPAPAVVHLKTGHFAALVERQGDRYRVADPVFDQEQWISADALDTEASGYVLAAELPQGFVPVDETEASEVWGKGCPNRPDPTQQSCPTTGGNCPSGSCPLMAGYTFLPLQAALRIRDTPISYAPPKGPSVDFTLTYNQKEVFQPSVFSYANVGPKWTFDLVSYVQDDPSSLATAAQTVRVYLRGGGMEVYTVPAGVAASAPEFRTRAVLARTSVDPVRYERRMIDGSVETFERPESAIAYPRKVFMTSDADPQGNKLTFLYGASLQLEAITDALGQVTTFAYGDVASLRIASVTDPFGRTATLGYDSQGRLSSITDTIGLTSSFTYGDGDFITSLTTPYGTTKFTTGDNGTRMWIEAEDPLGARERVEFVINHDSAIGPRHLPVSEIPTGFADLNGNFDAGLTLYWNKRAMLLAPNDPASAEVTNWLESLSHQPRGVVRASKMPLESRIWYRYEGQSSSHGNDGRLSAVGRIIDPDGPGGVAAQTQTTTYTRNLAGLPCSMIDPLLRETRYKYGTNNVPDENIPGLTCATGSSIDLLRVEQKNGAGWDLVRSATYDSKHQPLTTVDAANQTTTYTYNAAGQVATVTTPPRAGITEQRTTTYTYAPLTGYLSSVVSPGGVTTSYTYDAFGRVRTVLDNEGDTTTFDYDAGDRPTRTTYPDATYEEVVYDKLDARARRDRLGRWSETLHDPLRRVVSTRDPLNRVVTQEWCTCGSLNRLVDPNGNATAWERDLQGRVTKETRANGSFKTFAYDATSSRLRETVDARSQIIRYTYAIDDRLLSTTYPNPVIPTPNVTLSYDVSLGVTDPHGRLRSMTDGTGTTTYGYVPYLPVQKGAGQILTVDGPGSGDAVTYAYDELGRVVSRTMNGVSTTMAYDQQGRVTQVGDPIGNFGYTYHGNTGRTAVLTYPNGQTTVFDYHGAADDHRLSQIRHTTTTAATMLRFEYGYDDVGNIKQWRNQGATGSPLKTYALEYDPADQLTAATYQDNTPATLQRYRYAYDPAGNRTAEQVGDAVTGAAHDTMNRLLSHQPGSGAQLFRGTTNEAARVTVQAKPAETTATNQFSGNATVGSGQTDVVVQATDYDTPTPRTTTKTYRVTPSGATRSFAYDPNGNLSSKTEGAVTTTYEWDAENRLTAVRQGATTLASFTYDGQGRRRTKAANGVTATFFWDGSEVLEERSTAFADRRYVHGPGIDQHLAMVEGGTPTYFFADHLGSIVRGTNSAGAVVLTREYDAWGNLLQGASVNGYAFTGREWDAETGLYYYRARHYDPRLGRFISEDPLGILADRNLFRYVENSPSVLTDPMGLQASLPPIATLCNKGIDPSAVYVICCKPGGKIGVCRGPAPLPSSSHVNDCMLEHEDKHIDDLNNNIFPCDKNKCVTPNLTNCPVTPGNKSNTECSGYCRELRCLQGKPQTPDVRTRLTAVRAKLGQYCLGGGRHGCTAP